VGADELKTSVLDGCRHFGSRVVVVAGGFDFFIPEGADLLEGPCVILGQEFSNRIELQAERKPKRLSGETRTVGEGGSGSEGCGAGLEEVSA
jgi:hypothetical protein